MSTIAKYTTALLLGFTVVAHSLCAEESGRDTLGHNLLEAVRNHNTKKIDDILQSSPNLVNFTTKFISPLHIACENGHTNIVRQLLRYGAHPNCMVFDDETPLHLAVSEGHHEVVQLLLRHGAFHSPCYKMSRITPLHIAVDYDFQEICLTLVKHGAYIDALDENDQTPMDLLIESGKYDAAWLLIDHAIPAHPTQRVFRELTNLPDNIINEILSLEVVDQQNNCCICLNEVGEDSLKELVLICSSSDQHQACIECRDHMHQSGYVTCPL